MEDYEIYVKNLKVKSEKIKFKITNTANFNIFI